MIDFGLSAEDIFPNDEIIDLLILLLLFSSFPEKALETVNNGSAPVVINTQKQPEQINHKKKEVKISGF